MPSSLWQRATQFRYSKAAETYARNGSQIALNNTRSGLLASTAVAARAAERAEHAPATPASPDTPPPGDGAGVLATLASGVQTAIGWEQSLTAPLGKIPFPGTRALRVLDMAMGLPHAHMHPPNLTPPNPVPVALSSVGPIIEIPFLSGASGVKINGRAAARCGDMGLGVWCGGYFPWYEVFLGSANVWTEGARAGRLVIDVTKHCVFSAPKPSDPPLGPMVGTTIAVGSGDVFIGGVPLPSLFSLACAQLFKAAFKGAGAAFRRASARSYVYRLMRDEVINIGGTVRYAGDIMEDLTKMAKSPTGRRILRDIEKSGRKVEIRPYHEFGDKFYNATAQAANMDAVMDAVTGLPGSGANSVVKHSPNRWASHPDATLPHKHPGSTSDSILAHEMNHARNNALGRGQAQTARGDTGPVKTSKHGWDERWKNYEEYKTVQAENAYRREQGLPERTHYGKLP
ncbi:MAG: M91 family zinc metallopeptidase [Enhygromyxa sp.]